MFLTFSVFAKIARVRNNQIIHNSPGKYHFNSKLFFIQDLPLKPQLRFIDSLRLNVKGGHGGKF